MMELSPISTISYLKTDILSLNLVMAKRVTRPLDLFVSLIKDGGQKNLDEPGRRPFGLDKGLGVKTNNPRCTLFFYGHVS